MVIDRSPMGNMKEHVWHPVTGNWSIWVCELCEAKIASILFVPKHLNGRVCAVRRGFNKPVALDMSMYCCEVLVDEIINETEDYV